MPYRDTGAKTVLDDWVCERKLTFLHRGEFNSHKHMDWMTCAERLSNNECDWIISTCRAFDTIAPIVVGEDRLAGHRKADTRLLMVTEETAWFFDLICTIAERASEEAYGLALSGISRAPQYAEYREGFGEFGWHNDYSHGMEEAPRKLTIIFQLSDPRDYEGGLLQVMGNEIETMPQARGTIIVFPSLLVHRVTPVVSGVRKALVSWIAGPRHV
ncbi:PKHD-type hydroxylase [Labrenzia sp. EL_142]|nr:PKHD-type hydroxylase [Labrenzia sp. EL_142]